MNISECITDIREEPYMSDLWGLLNQASSALLVVYEDYFIYKDPANIELNKEEKEELLEMLGIISDQVYLLKCYVEGENDE